MCTVVEYCNVGPAGRVRCCGKNDANSSKQGSKRFNSITKKIHFAYLGILFFYRPGELALSCNPSYREVRTVGWFEVLRPLTSLETGYL